jgi:hypothetical protein
LHLLVKHLVILNSFIMVAGDFVPGFASARDLGVKPVETNSTVKDVSIFDIRGQRAEYSILEDIKQGLRPKPGVPRSLPTLLLYDTKGLQLFEKITYLDEYYLTNAEIEVLEQYSDRIAERISGGSIIVELGSG